MMIHIYEQTEIFVPAPSVRPYLWKNMVDYSRGMKTGLLDFMLKELSHMRLLPRRGIFENGRVMFLPVDAVVPNPHQPRTVFDRRELEELSDSIRELGVLQPLSVRKTENGWELVAGERRLRAAKLAGLKEVPCLAVQADGQASSLLALVENLQRRDLGFLEEARALRRLIDEFDLSQEETARRIGKSQSAVANKLRILKLPPEALEVLQNGGASERHARALLKLPGAETQLAGAREAMSRHYTVAQTERMVEHMLAAAAPKRKKPVFIVKDVRLFLNTISHSMDLMRSAGVDAKLNREDSEQEILLTIHIPTHANS